MRTFLITRISDITQNICRILFTEIHNKMFLKSIQLMVKQRSFYFNFIYL